MISAKTKYAVIHSRFCELFVFVVAVAVVVVCLFLILQYHSNQYSRTLDFPGGSVVKCLPAMQESQVRSLGWEAALEKEMATHSSGFCYIFLPGKSQGQRSLAGYRPWGQKRIRHDLVSLTLVLKVPLALKANIIGFTGAFVRNEEF